MNIEKINSLIRQINAAKLVSVDGFVVEHTDTYPPIGDNDRIVAVFTWENGGEYTHVYVKEQGLSDAVVKGNRIELNDADGEFTSIEIFSLQSLNFELNW